VTGREPDNHLKVVIPAEARIQRELGLLPETDHQSWPLTHAHREPIQSESLEIAA